MSVNFIAKALEEDEIPSEKTLRQETNKLYSTIKAKGLSASHLKVILQGLEYWDMDVDCFKNLIRCLIPNTIVPKHLLERIIEWIFELRIDPNERNFEKIECILIWIASLLDFDLIHESINDWYYLFDSLLQFFIKPVSHILYTLTKTADVTATSIVKVQRLLEMHDRDPCLCTLLNRYKELNTEYSSVKVPQYKKPEKVFSYNETVYSDLRAGLKNIKHNFERLAEESIVVPLKKKKIAEDHVLPDAFYQPHTEESQQGYCYIHNISTGAQLGKNFRGLILPSHTLTLMKNEVGIYVLMFTKRSLQDNFFCNLHAVLQKSFISQPDGVSSTDKEGLLSNLITLHSLFGQGFLCVSKFLSVFLQRWDGVTFKNQILLLLEWFVFKSETDLQNNLMKPLYSLFVIGDGTADLMCDILTCLTNLITNLFFMIKKEEQSLQNLYEEDILHTREQLEPVLKNLFEYFAHLCEHALYQFPCNTRILEIAINFYKRVDMLDFEEMNCRTIISSCVLYHSLLSFNAQMMNEVCALMPSYRNKTLANKYSSSGMDDMLLGYVGDLYNFLWTSKAFTDRVKGHIFYNLNPYHSQAWSSFANLNNGLDILRHVMFEPYRSLAVQERNLPVRRITSKNTVLEILREHVPHIVKFIETVLNNACFVRKTGDSDGL